MREFVICFFLWCKRLFKRPLFCFSLLLIPASVLFLQNVQTQKDAFIQVALYSPQENADPIAEELLQHMLSLSNTAIRFYECNTAKELQKDVASGKAACGYLFPEHMEQTLERYATEKKPFIHVIRSQSSINTKIVDEIVLSKLYEPLSYYILTHYLSQKWDISAEESLLQKTFRSHSSSELLFQFEYADGEENTILNDSKANYMLMPLRGIISVMILLSCLTGGLLCYADRENKLLLMDSHKRALCNFLSLLIPGAVSGMIGLLAIKMAGIMTSPVMEIPAMMLFVFCCMGFTRLLWTICCCREFFLAAIPILTIGSLIISPVFLNLSDLIPALAPVSLLFPTTHYLNAIYDFSSWFSLLLFIFLSNLFSSSNSRIKG